MFDKTEFIKALEEGNVEKAKVQINFVKDINNFFIKDSNLLHVAIDFNQPEIVRYLIEEKYISLTSPNRDLDLPLKAAIKANKEDGAVVDALLKKMSLSDIKEQYLALQDSGYAAEDRVREYILTCREFEMKLRQDARKNPSTLLGIAGKLPEKSELKKEITEFVQKPKNDHEGMTLGGICKKIVDVFREMFGLDDLTKVVKKINNEPELRSNVKQLENQRTSQASQSNQVG